MSKELFEVKYKQMLIEWELVNSNIRSLDAIIFKIRGWAVSIISAITAYTFVKHETSISLFGILPVLMFWSMDALYKSFQIIFIHRSREIETYLRSDKFDKDFENKVKPSLTTPNTANQFGINKNSFKKIVSAAFTRNVFLTYLYLIIMCLVSYVVIEQIST